MKILFYIHKVAFYVTLWLWLTLIYGAIAEFFLGCLQLITAIYLYTNQHKMNEAALSKFRLYGRHLLFYTAFVCVGCAVSMMIESITAIIAVCALVYAMVLAFLFVDVLEANTTTAKVEQPTEEAFF